MTIPRTSRSFSVLSAASTIKSAIADVANFRWLIFILTSLAICSNQIIGTSLSLTIVAMIGQKETTNLTENFSNQSDVIIMPITSSDGKQYVHWSGTEKSRMLAALFWGGLATSVLGGRLGEVYGPKRAIALCLLSAGLLNLLYPIVALHSYVGAYIIRIIQGISVGVSLPVSFIVVARWSTQYERTLSNAVVRSGSVLANIIAHPLAGLLVSGNFLGGWPSVFYVLGAVNLLMVIPWWFFAYDNPEDHPYLTADELEVILTRRSIKSGATTKIPWIKLLTSIPVYAYLIVPLTYGFFYGAISTQIPSFYKDVLHFSHEANGFMASLPWILSIISSIGGSFLADRIRKTKRFSINKVRKAFAIIGLGGASLFLCLVTFVGKRNKVTIAVFIAIAKGMGTLNVAGSQSCHLDMCPTFAGTLAGFSAMFMSLSSLAANEAVAVMIGNTPTEQKWYQFFYLTAIVNAAGCIIFCIFGSSKIQEWDPSYRKSHVSKSPSHQIPPEVQNTTNAFQGTPAVISMKHIPSNYKKEADTAC